MKRSTYIIIGFYTFLLVAIVAIIAICGLTGSEKLTVQSFDGPLTKRTIAGRIPTAISIDEKKYDMWTPSKNGLDIIIDYSDEVTAPVLEYPASLEKILETDINGGTLHIIFNWENADHKIADQAEYAWVATFTKPITLRCPTSMHQIASEFPVKISGYNGHEYTLTSSDGYTFVDCAIETVKCKHVTHNDGYTSPNIYLTHSIINRLENTGNCDVYVYGYDNETSENASHVDEIIWKTPNDYNGAIYLTDISVGNITTRPGRNGNINISANTSLTATTQAR